MVNLFNSVVNYVFIEVVLRFAMFWQCLQQCLKQKNTIHCVVRYVLYIV